MIDMKRRELITLLGGAAVGWPLGARAQEATKPPTIGLLGANTPSAESQWVAAFVQRLRELGWIEGRTVAIEYRWAEARAERAAEIAAEFVRLKVDVIVTYATTPALAAKKATSVIPIVLATSGDPLGTGLVTSLARPGGNVTGSSLQPILPASDSNCCASLYRVFARWRSWPTSAVLTPCWICARFGRPPVRLVSRSSNLKSDARRISHAASRHSRAAF
jgi:ABC transporter substrate binding protein